MKVYKRIPLSMIQRQYLKTNKKASIKATEVIRSTANAFLKVLRTGRL